MLFIYQNDFIFIIILDSFPIKYYSLEKEMASTKVSKRRLNILTFLNEYLEASIEQISDVFNISQITARRDLDQLCDEGLAWKVNRGLYTTDKFHGQSYAPYITVEENEREIVSLALNAIKNRSIIYLSKDRLISLLSIEVIKNRNDLTVITPSITVASNFRNQDHHDVYLLGGAIDPINQIVTGNFAEKMLEDFVIDYVFFECKALDWENGFLLDNTAEVSFLDIAYERCQNFSLLATSTTLATEGSGVVLSFKKVSKIFTDPLIDPKTKEKFAAMSIETIHSLEMDPV